MYQPDVISSTLSQSLLQLKILCVGACTDASPHTWLNKSLHLGSFLGLFHENHLNITANSCAKKCKQVLPLYFYPGK